MKILQHGYKHDGIVLYHVNCACGCEFEFDKKDPAIKCKTYSNGLKHYYIECPDCGNQFRLICFFSK